MEEHLNIYVNKFTMLKLLGLGIICLLIGLKSAESDYIFFRVIGFLNILLSVISLVVASRNVFRQKPVIIISLTDGIIDSRLLKRFLPWSKIDSCEIIEMQNQVFLKICADKSISLDSFKTLFKITSNKSFRKTSVFKINLSAMNVERNEIQHFIEGRNQILKNNILV
ncbi:STM3941 family protein [Chryseobacterium sp.]|uniref:STM3941 family protein n=1 Tax=Chryseobacterium sp. TaxID=1871047 RepID=UPI0011C9611A|nr:STM3941 family protein [Chryseobacterium sp.]TXF74885.1 hypothetical protein FUA25_11390 [Chryseobacterium sp.]